MGHLLVVFHHGVESRASRASWYGYGVHVYLYGDDAALVSLAHLLGDVEDEGGVETVVEDHLQVHVVLLAVAQLAAVFEPSAGVAGNAECEHAAAGNVNLLAFHVAVALPSRLVGHCHGVVAAAPAVEHRRARESRDVARALHAGNLAVVVVHDDLRQVDIGDGCEHHVEVFHPGVARGVVVEAVVVAVDLYGALVGGEELLRLVEGVGVSLHVVPGAHHRLVGVYGDGVEGRRLVEVEALHALLDLQVVPHEHIPEAVVELPLEGVALNEVAGDAAVAVVGRGAGEVSAYVEGVGHGIADVAPDAAVFVVPSVVPLRLPVVALSGFEDIVPVGVELDFGDDKLRVHRLRLVEVEGRLGLAGDEQQGQQQG